MILLIYFEIMKVSAALKNLKIRKIIYFYMSILLAVYMMFASKLLQWSKIYINQLTFKESLNWRKASDGNSSKSRCTYQTNAPPNVKTRF